METDSLTKPKASSSMLMTFGSHTQSIKDYQLLFSVSDFKLDRNLKTVFPKIGYLIFNFFTGENYTYRFLNYDFEDRQPSHLYITGMFSQGPLIFNQQGQGKGYALKIHPVLGYHLLKAPMYLFTDSSTQISFITGKSGALLRKLEEDRKIDSIDNYYLKQFLQSILPDKPIVQCDPIFHAVNAIIRSKGIIRIKKLAAQFCMSERTLHRQFLLKVGLSPKAYAKIWQWQYVMELLQSQPHISLQELAFKAGYYDAAHLEHDFKEKVLQTPSQFRQNINPLLEDYLNFPGSLG